MSRLLIDSVGTPLHLEVARLLGVPTSPRVDGHEWNGRTLCTSTKLWVFVHNVAHWVVCDPDRRVLSEFGLGMSDVSQEGTHVSPPVEDGDRSFRLNLLVERVRSLPDCWDEELMACAVERALLDRLGLPWTVPPQPEEWAYDVGIRHHLRRSSLD